MKKKIACLLMALMLIISLLPMGVSAASYLYPSENVVALIKQFEGFSASAYQDGGRWTIGYGTEAYAGQTITETQADAALRTKLSSISTAINNFTAQHNLMLSQNQHDALLCLSYNCGTTWINDGGRLCQAIVNHATGNQFLFAISLWANQNSVPSANLLNRRMAEANLYLNGIYSTYAPSAYAWTVFDPNGGIAGTNGEDKMQGYTNNSSVEIMVANPTKAGYTFGGWFTSSTGGTGVKALTSATANRSVYAQYGVPVTVSGTNTVVYAGPGTGYSTVGTVNAGAQIVIVESTTVNGVQWGHYVDGWVMMTNVNGSTSGSVPSGGGSSTAYATGMVIATSGVNVRSGPGTGYSVVGSRYNGATVSIYETVNNNGMSWGRIGDGQWISLSYVRITSGTVPAASSSTTGSTSTTTGSTGSVIWSGSSAATTVTTGGTTSAGAVTGRVTTNGVNVRSGAGTNYPVVTILNSGASVNVYSQVTAGGMTWGRIDQGYICMNYVSLNTTTSTSTASTGTTVVATGIVHQNVNLNVRSGPGTGYQKVNSVAGGTQVSIYERVTSGGAEWGRIGNGAWICLTYVTITGGSTGSTTSTTTATTATTTTGTGVVTASNLHVRSGPGTGYASVSALVKGNSVTVYETTNVNGVLWGRIGSNAWVCMSYISMTSSVIPSGTTATTGTTTTTTGSTFNGTVTADRLNVRAAAGTGNSIVGYLYKGSAVTVYETTYVNGVAWGRVGNGWVCMSYIALNGTSAGTVSWS